MTCFCHFVCLSGTKDIPQTVWKRLFNSEYTLPVMQTDQCKYICTFCQICDNFYMGILQWLYKGWLWRLWASISWWTVCVLNDELLTASALWNKRKKKKEDFFYINIIASVDQPQICGLSNPKIFSAILQLALYDMTTQMGQMS